MKKIIIFLLIISFCIVCPPAICENGEICVLVDNVQVKFDVAPQIIDGRTMVPLRAIFEALGANVTWDDNSKTVYSYMSDTKVSLTIGVKSITVNNTVIALDVAPVLLQSKTFVPVRAVSEAYGCFVNWDDENKTVIIATDNYEQSSENSLNELKLSIGDPLPQNSTYIQKNVTYKENDIISTVLNGDKFRCGDYSYTYFSDKNGWSCTEVLDKTKKEYGAIYSSILGQPVVILDNTFTDCTQMIKAPAIPSGVKSLYSTYRNCVLLTEVPKIPKGVTSLANTYKDCKSLVTAPLIPYGVENAYATFFGCSNLKIAPKFPDTTTNFSHTYYNCENLEYLPEFPKYITNMESTFYKCGLLTSIPPLPETVISLNRTFDSCKGLLVAPLIPESAVDLNGTFGVCTSITLPENFKIPDGVKTIRNLFSYCYNITWAPSVPESVENMEGAFQYCSALEGTVKIDANPVKYDNCFVGTMKKIHITGDCEERTKENLSKTSKRNNISFS